MRIAVCDDEKAIRDMLADKVVKLYPDAELYFFTAGEEVLQAEEKPDILFLDIRMSGKDEIETARELREKNARMIIIFVTGMEE